MADMPQIQNMPDPIANMAQVQVAPVPVKYIDVSNDPPLFQFLTQMVKDGADKFASMAATAVVKTFDAAVSAGDKAFNVGKDVMDPQHNAPKVGKDDPSPSHGLGRERSVEVSPSLAQLGGLPSPSTPGMGVQVDQGRAV